LFLLFSALPTSLRKKSESFLNVNEKNQRLFAAVEAIKIGPGGISYIAKIASGTRTA
jgi:hypothetical protein